MSLLGLGTTIIRQTVAQEPEPEEIAVAFIVDTACDVGAACSVEGSTCNNGKTETCCGETFNSFECECDNGAYMCMYTDMCMYPMCDTDTSSTVAVAGIVVGDNPLPVEIVVEGGDPSIIIIVDEPDPVVSVDQTPTDAPTYANTPMLGGYDEYGCSPSAGYTWCPELEECIQGFNTPCPLVGTDFEGQILISCSNGRCNLEPNDCLINMGSWMATGPYLNGMDGEYPIPKECTATCDDGCVAIGGVAYADADVDADGVDKNDTSVQTEDVDNGGGAFGGS